MRARSHERADQILASNYCILRKVQATPLNAEARALVIFLMPFEGAVEVVHLGSQDA